MRFCIRIIGQVSIELFFLPYWIHYPTKKDTMSSRQARRQARRQASKMPFPKTPITKFAYSIVIPNSMSDVVPEGKERERYSKLLIDTFNHIQRSDYEWGYIDNGKFVIVNTVSKDMFGGELVALCMYMYDMKTLKPTVPPSELMIPEEVWRGLYATLSEEKYGGIVSVFPLERMAKMAGLDMSSCPLIIKNKLLSEFCGGDPLSIITKITPTQFISLYK
jgi:hypothetical protein